MKALDRFIQRWRMRQALRFIPTNARIIDIGAHEGELFMALGNRLQRGYGVEPLCPSALAGRNFTVVPGFFPAVRPAESGWDVVTILAVLEHIPTAQQAALAVACHELLRPGGRVIITVPAKAVDHILAVLRFLRLIDGMSLEEHYGFEPGDTLRIFPEPSFKLVHRSRFQGGLNHLFVLEREG
ncbi:MAG TPA: methyltransferase domain-containing protein [Lacunisphaera sp.]|nr:methyltransferase domain-containing protein [Lacunisphaera sp.]